VIVRRVAIAALRFYKSAISPWLPPACRFQPTCSEYAMEAIEMHGLAAGSWLAIRRLARCHPFSRGGFDPVPAPRPHRH
jgi:putative membrane protein insertion efficiency factor